MAKKGKLELDRFDLDDDLNLPEFNFGTDEVSDDRKPTTKIRDSIKAGARQSLSNPATYQRMMRHALPREYGEAYDDAERIGQNIRRVYKDAVNEIRPAGGDLARTMNTFVPDSMRRTKDTLRKIEKWGQGDPKNKDNTESQREDNIALEIGNVFKV